MAKIWLLALLWGLTFFPATARAASTTSLFLAQHCRKVPGITEWLVSQHDTMVELDYSQQQLLRQFCQLPDLRSEQLFEILAELQTAPLPFATLALLEAFTERPGTDVAGSRQLLRLLAADQQLHGRSLESLPQVAELSAAGFLNLAERTLALPQAGQWAARALFAVNGSTAAFADSGLQQLASLGEQQQRAAEQLLLLNNVPAAQALSLLTRLGAASDTAARHLRVLLAQPGLPPVALSQWLDGYFLQDHKHHDQLFTGLSPTEKEQLLKAFAGSAADFIWIINNLHDITDDLGQEIGSARLAAMSVSQLLTLWQRLDATTRSRFQREKEQAASSGARGQLLALLRQATASARRQAALELSSANIYVLLATGGELYDSSFRDIAAPVLHERIRAQYGGDLLAFLRDTDPSGSLVADFLAHLAQKGRLTDFFPADTSRQLNLVALLARSAFTSESSLLLFSASLGRLLTTLRPEARAFLLAQLRQVMGTSSGLLARQLQVVGQYFLQEHAPLLPAGEAEALRQLIARRGHIDLRPYLAAPFAAWRQDGRLRSLSVFQTDDDGRASYLSNARTLLASGYQARLSSDYTLASADTQRQATALLPRLGQDSSALPRLFQLSTSSPLVVSWHKQVRGLDIGHAVYVYQGAARQKELLARFFALGDEMFAQRGHSYWRQEQLLEPLTALLAESRLESAALANPPRFLSLGSCGGMRVYQELNRLFAHQVDILATVGSGKEVINNLYNQQFLEIVAQQGTVSSWREVVAGSAAIFRDHLGEDYLQPGSLPAILHKMTPALTPDHAAD